MAFVERLSSSIFSKYLEKRWYLAFISNYEKISNVKLAEMTGISVRQFERRFKSVFSTTPHKYALKLRIFKACESLLNKNVTIAELALELGFYDQSAFSNTFKKHVGLSPLQYVSKNRK